AIAADDAGRHRRPFGKQGIKEGSVAGLGLPPHTERSGERAFDVDIRFDGGTDRQSDGRRRVGINGLSDAPSKTRPKGAAHRRKLAATSDDVNAAQSIFAADFGYNCFHYLKRTIDQVATAFVEFVDRN